MSNRPVFEENWYIEPTREYNKPPDFTRWKITTVPRHKYIFVKRSVDEPSNEEFIDAIKLKLAKLNKLKDDTVIARQAGKIVFEVLSNSHNPPKGQKQ